jgi:hypothetical protein
MNEVGETAATLSEPRFGGIFRIMETVTGMRFTGFAIKLKTENNPPLRIAIGV